MHSAPRLVYFSGDWDVHWGYDLDFEPWPSHRLWGGGDLFGETNTFQARGEVCHCRCPAVDAMRGWGCFCWFGGMFCWVGSIENDKNFGVTLAYVKRFEAPQGLKLGDT